MKRKKVRRVAIADEVEVRPHNKHRKRQDEEREAIWMGVEEFEWEMDAFAEDPDVLRGIKGTLVG